MGRKGSGLAVLAVVAAMLCLVFTMPAFAGPKDNVLSENIKEADGTTGQDTNSGSGVKTGHIQDGAVTDAKITGPISGSKISSSGLDADTVDGQHATDLAPAVHGHNGSDITDGTVSTSKIADGAVTTPKIINGAVTDAKISGTISGSKLGSHTHSGSDIVSGTIGVDRLATYAGVRIVHKGAADGVNTFNTISAALSSITDNSASNRYVVMVMPGTYDQLMVQMKSYVDIVGSGQENTTVTGTIDWRLPDITLENLRVQGYIMCTGTGVIRDVTFEVANTYSEGIMAFNAELEIYDSKILVADATVNTYSIRSAGPATLLYISGTTIDVTSNAPGVRACGIGDFRGTLDNSIIRVKSIDGGSGICGANGATIMNSRITVETDTDQQGCYGIDGGDLTIQNSAISAVSASIANNSNVGVYQYSGVGTIENSTVSSSHTGVFGSADIDNSKIIGAVAGIDKGSGSFRVGASQISGGHNGSSGVDKVVNCHDGSYNPIPDL